MEILRCAEVIKAVDGILLSGDIGTKFYGVSTDSRNIKQGDLFIPLVGERFDGHDYICKSLQGGALGSFTQNDGADSDGGVLIKVPDTLKALGKLAAYYRGKFDIPFIGITGSVGKTSTKEMISCILHEEFNVHKTQGNFNNEVGVPITIFELGYPNEVSVIEMGMSGFGEISYLTSIVRPNIALITNIGVSHMEKLGSKNNILKAKMEVLEGLNKEGVVILNGDDSLLYSLKELLDYKTVFYGIGEELDYQGYNIESLGENGSTFDVQIKNREYTVKVPVPGMHNIYNALAGIAVGAELGMVPEKIIRGIEKFIPEKMRLNIISHNSIKIIDDIYNASPQSTKAAIDVLRDISKNSRTIAVLGDMLELGDISEEAHFDIGRYAIDMGVDHIVSIGKYRNSIVDGAFMQEQRKWIPSPLKATQKLRIFKGFCKGRGCCTCEGF